MESVPSLVFILFTLLCLIFLGNAELTITFYHSSCPKLEEKVASGVRAALVNDSRIAASLLRLHFHDCFVNGCEGSVLLDGPEGEKNALPNNRSARGFELIDTIKKDVEGSCPGIVSCTDILALAARESVCQSGDPCYPLPLGRRDGRTASREAANKQIPSPKDPLATIIEQFTSKGLTVKDVVVLSGAHSIGFAQCLRIKKSRLYDYMDSGKSDPSLPKPFLESLLKTCPNRPQSDETLLPIDGTTVGRFDVSYYRNILNRNGLLLSDQALLSSPETVRLVKSLAGDQALFFREFSSSIVKMAGLGVLTGAQGEIRRICGRVN